MSRILTGDRPTGKLHLGHYVGSLKNRIEYENSFEQFIIIADIQALTDNWKTPGMLKKNIFEVTKDYLAVGLNPEKSTFFIQSMIPELAELSVYFFNLVTVNRLKRNPTVKAEVEQKGFGESLPVGFFVYPISQAADILAFRPTHVPVGEDQLPMIEQTNEIARSFNHTYKTNLFSDVKAVVPKCGRLSGIDGQGKMSKSLNNGIFLSDDADTVAAKVKKMYTDPNHIRVEDPGKVEGNIVFQYLDVFDSDTQKVAELKAHYQKGGLGDMVLKRRLTDILNSLLEPIRQRRKEYEDNDNYIESILKEGTEKAKSEVSKTMKEIRSSMHISYF